MKLIKKFTQFSNLIIFVDCSHLILLKLSLRTWWSI